MWWCSLYQTTRSLHHAPPNLSARHWHNKLIPTDYCVASPRNDGYEENLRLRLTTFPSVVNFDETQTRRRRPKSKPNVRLRSAHKELKTVHCSAGLTGVRHWTSLIALQSLQSQLTSDSSTLKLFWMQRLHYKLTFRLQS